MVSWMKSVVILVLVMSLVLLLASTQAWPVDLIVQGSILALLAAFFGIANDTASSRRGEAFGFLVLAIAVFLGGFLTIQALHYGIRAMVEAVFTGDGPAGGLASEGEAAVSLSLIIEIIACVLMIRYVPCRTLKSSAASGCPITSRARC